MNIRVTIAAKPVKFFSQTPQKKFNAPIAAATTLKNCSLPIRQCLEAPETVFPEPEIPHAAVHLPDQVNAPVPEAVAEKPETLINSKIQT